MYRTGTGGPIYDRQVQLNGLVYFCLLAPDRSSPMLSAVRSTALVEISSPASSATVIEGSFRSHRRQHSPNPGRQIFVFNVQSDVEGDLAFATV